MSTEAFDRARVRQAILSRPFEDLYFNDDDRLERVIILGLYSGTYNHGFAYLQEIEAEQLQAVIDEYNQNMAKLTTDRAKYVLEVAAKRYLANIDQQIFDQKVTTRQNQLDAENQKWDSRIVALEADRAALETLRQKTVLAESQAEIRISEISAQVMNEQYTQSELDNEQARKAIELARAELQILKAANQGLEIQAQINDAAFQLYAVDADIAGLNAQVAGTLADISRNQRSEEEIEIERQKNANLEYEIEQETAAKIEDIEGRGMLINDEIDAVGDYLTQEQSEYAEKMNGLNVDQGMKLKNIELSMEEDQHRADMRVRSHANDLAFANDRKTTVEQKDSDDIVLIQAETLAEDQVVDATIEAAEFLSEVNIAETLFHSVGRG